MLPEHGKESNVVVTDIKTKRPNYFDALRFLLTVAMVTHIFFFSTTYINHGFDFLFV